MRRSRRKLVYTQRARRYEACVFNIASNAIMKKSLAVLAALAFVSSCGKSVECGKGTVEQDGECVASAPTNSTQSNTPNNESNTPNNESNTPNADVSCGPGTELNEQGLCVVSEPTTCGAGTQLDANSGECIVTDAVCGAGTAFDAGSDSCLPTADVCDVGTTFNEVMGICMADALCGPGDVLLVEHEGACVTFAEALWDTADVVETENNDPFFGGTPNTLTLNAAADAPVVFAGTINEPTDLDGDGFDDQDVDVVSFDAEAGQFIVAAVEVVEGPALTFEITGPNGYQRFVRRGAGWGAARRLVTAEAGTYEMRIAPLAAEGPGPGDLFGSDTHRYAATLSVETPPAARVVDFSAGATGQLIQNFDNLLTQDGLTPGPINLRMDMPFGRAQLIFLDGSTLVSSHDTFGSATVATTVPASGDLTVAVDWIEWDNVAFTLAQQPATSLGTIAVGTPLSNTTPMHDAPQLFSFDVPAGLIPIVSHTNDENQPMNFVVTLPGGTPFNEFIEPVGAPFGRASLVLPGAIGGGTVLLEATSTPRTNLVITVDAVQPQDIGMWTPPTTFSETSSVAISQGGSQFLQVDLTADAQIDGTLTSGPDDVDLNIYDVAGNEISRIGTAGGEDLQVLLTAGTYLFEIYAFSDLPNGYDFNGTVDPFVSVPEVEPNDSAATATPGLDGSTPGTGTVDAGDEDWFSFTMTSTQFVQVLSASGPGFGVEYELQNDAAELLSSGPLDTFAPFDAARLLEPGTYYIRLASFGGLEQYAVSLDMAPTGASDDDAGGNDDQANAQAVVLGASASIVGGLVSSTDADWYMFDLAAPATYQFGASANVVIYDSAMAVITPTAGLIDLPMGTSYAVVDSGFAPGAPNDYFISFSTPPTNTVTSSPAAIIPDAGLLGGPVLTDVITVPNGPPCTITNVQVQVDISHTFIGDLDITVTSPDGTTVKLWDRTGGSADDLIGIFPVTLQPAESLNVWLGENVVGDWTMVAGDGAGSDEGTLNSWSLHYDCQ